VSLTDSFEALPIDRDNKQVCDCGRLGRPRRGPEMKCRTLFISDDTVLCALFANKNRRNESRKNECTKDFGVWINMGCKGAWPSHINSLPTLQDFFCSTEASEKEKPF
jgi:hypothetical protein